MSAQTLPSLEARELAAAWRLAWDADHHRDRLSARPPGEGPGPVDHRGFLRDALAWEPLDPARATLLAEAWVVGAVAPSLDRYLQARTKVLVRLRPEAPGRSLDVHEPAVMVDPESVRRAAWVAAGDAAVAPLRPKAVAVVEALRGAVAGLPEGLRARVGFGRFDPAPVLAATDDLLYELDPAVARARSLDLSRGQWSERLASLVAPAVVRALPSATWAELGTGWASRVGLDAALGGLRGSLLPAHDEATGVMARVHEPGVCSLLAGRPGRTGMAAADVLGACGVAVAGVLGRGVSPGARRGLARASDGLWHALVRRLLLDPAWLAREAGVDAVTRQRVMLEALHGEVLRLRRDAVLAGFVSEALDGGAGASTRFWEAMRAAWGASPEPVWAVHAVVRAVEPGSWWGERPAAAVEGALAEPVALGWLRERFNEDWWRNPHAGPGVVALVAGVNALGVSGWCAAESAEQEGASALRARLAEVARVALR